VDGVTLKEFLLHVETEESDKAYDTAPGGSSALALSALDGLNGLPIPDITIPLWSPEDLYISMSNLSLTTYASHYCFIPTRSSISAGEGISINGAFSCGQGTSDRCTMNTDPTPLPGEYGVSTPEVNQDHVFLDARIGDVLVDELDAANLIPGGLFPSSLTTYYNAGLPVQSGIPTITITTGLGELYINNAGKVSYANTGDPDSPLDHLNAYTKCEAVITVEARAKLVIGAKSENKDATLRVTKGSAVQIRANGTLRINTSSALIIEKGGKLVLDAGAIVELYDQPGGALVPYGRPRIHIQEGGQLIFNGNIVFRGDGYFEFDKGNQVIMPSTFTFTGSGKAYRHFKINDNAQLLKTGGILSLIDCRVQVGCRAKLHIADFTRLVLLRTAFEDIDNATCSSVFISEQMAVHAEHGQDILALQSDFKNTRTGIRASQIAGNIRVEGCTFTNQIGADFYQIHYAVFSSVQGDFAAFKFDEAATGVSFLNCTLVEGCAVCPFLDDIITLTDVKMLLMTGGLIDSPVNGFTGIKAVLGENNVYMQKGATIQNTFNGIEMQGGLLGHANGTDFGLVRMDCSRILDCINAGITGVDVLLDIDAGINSVGIRPNEFRNTNASLLFDICYDQRDPSQVLANYNYWNRFDGFGNPTGPAADEYSLTKTLTTLGFCNIPAPLVTDFIAPDYDDTCPYRGRHEGMRERDDIEPYKFCSLEGDTLHNAFTGAWESVDAALDAAQTGETIPDFQEALSQFEPIAWQDSLTTAAAESVCRHYIDVARIFVPADGDAEARSGHSYNQPIAYVFPNPTRRDFQLVLPAGNWQVSISDLLGRRVVNSRMPGTQTIATENWTGGVYLIYYYNADDPMQRGQIKAIVNQ